MSQLDDAEAYSQDLLSHNLGLNVGPSMLGYVFDLAMLGISSHQIFVHYVARTNDRWMIRVLVYWAFTMGLFQTIYQIVHMWELFVFNFGKFLGFVSFEKYGWYPAIIAATALPVQLFYLDKAYRLWYEPLWVPIALIPCILGSVTGGIGATVQLQKQGLDTDYTTVNRWFFVWDACTLLADIGLTTVILVGLAKAKTGWSHTDSTISRFIKLLAEAQLVPVIMAIGILVNVLVDQTSSMLFFWFHTIGKTYIVSMPAVLNFRVSVEMERSSLQGSRSKTPNISRPMADGTLGRDFYEMGNMTAGRVGM